MMRHTQAHEIEPFLSDASNMRGRAEGVVFPENEKEIAEFLQEASAQKMPVTLSGCGTGLAGGRVPAGGWVMALHRLNAKEIRTFSPGAPARAVVGAGTALKDLQQAAFESGLFYPSDPTSLLSFLGGNAATNASGSHAFKYGVTRDHVRRLRVVLADGSTADLSRGAFRADAGRMLEFEVKTKTGKEVRKLRLPDYAVPPIKHSAGYFVKPEVDAVDLFIGSEGTLGVITELELNLLPRPPVIMSFIVFFPLEESAWQFAEDAQRYSLTNRHARNDALIQARSFEYMDMASLELIRGDYTSIPAGAQAAIYLEQECQAETQEWLLDQWSALFEKHGAFLEDLWVGETPEDEEKFRAFRHAVPLKVKAFLKQCGQTKVGTDYAVPQKYFHEMLRYEKKRVKELGLYSVSFGHMADCHLHLNILPRSPEEHARAWGLYEELVDRALACGGTIAAEHGVGKLKTGFLERMFGPKAIREMIELKKQLDPAGILGRGTLFPEERLGPVN